MEYVSLGRSGLKVSPLVPRHDDVRRPHRRGRLRHHHRHGARRRPQLRRHRRRLQRGPLGGDRRPRHQGRPRRLGAGHQGLQPDGQGPERSRPVAPLADARLRGQPAPPRDGLDRRLLPPQGGPLDPARGDRLGARRPDPPGQDPLLRPLQLPLLADRRGRQPVRAPGRRPPGRPPALLQPPQPHARGRAAARLRPSTASASSPTARSPAASCRPSTTPTRRRRPAPAPAPRTSGCMETEWRRESLVIARG